MRQCFAGARSPPNSPDTRDAVEQPGQPIEEFLTWRPLQTSILPTKTLLRDLGRDTHQGKTHDVDNDVNLSAGAHQQTEVPNITSPESPEWRVEVEKIGRAIVRRAQRVREARAQERSDHTERQYRASNYRQQRDFLRQAIEEVIARDRKQKRAKGSGTGSVRAELQNRLLASCDSVEAQDRKVADADDRLEQSAVANQTLEDDLVNAVLAMLSLLSPSPEDSAERQASKNFLAPSHASDPSESRETTDDLSPEVRAYYDRVGEAKIAQERLVELLFEHQDEQERLDFLLDQGREVGVSPELFEQHFKMSLDAAEVAVRDAVKSAETAYHVCLEHGFAMTKIAFPWEEANEAEGNEEAPPLYHISTSTGVFSNVRHGTMSPAARTEPVVREPQGAEAKTRQQPHSVERIQDWIQSLERGGNAPSSEDLAAELVPGLSRASSMQSLPLLGSPKEAAAAALDEDAKQPLHQEQASSQAETNSAPQDEVQLTTLENAFPSAALDDAARASNTTAFPALAFHAAPDISPAIITRNLGMSTPLDNDTAHLSIAKEEPAAAVSPNVPLSTDSRAQADFLTIGHGDLSPRPSTGGHSTLPSPNSEEPSPGGGDVAVTPATSAFGSARELLKPGKSSLALKLIEETLVGDERQTAVRGLPPTESNERDQTSRSELD